MRETRGRLMKAKILQGVLVAIVILGILATTKGGDSGGRIVSTAVSTPLAAGQGVKTETPVPATPTPVTPEPMTEEPTTTGAPTTPIPVTPDPMTEKPATSPLPATTTPKPAVPTAEEPVTGIRPPTEPVVTMVNQGAATTGELGTLTTEPMRSVPALEPQQDSSTLTSNHDPRKRSRELRWKNTRFVGGPITNETQLMILPISSLLPVNSSKEPFDPESHPHIRATRLAADAEDPSFIYKAPDANGSGTRIVLTLALSNPTVNAHNPCRLLSNAAKLGFQDFALFTVGEKNKVCKTKPKCFQRAFSNLFRGFSEDGGLPDNITKLFPWRNSERQNLLLYFDATDVVLAGGPEEHLRRYLEMQRRRVREVNVSTVNQGGVQWSVRRENVTVSPYVVEGCATCFADNRRLYESMAGAGNWTLDPSTRVYVCPDTGAQFGPPHKMQAIFKEIYPMERWGIEQGYLAAKGVYQIHYHHIVMDWDMKLSQSFNFPHFSRRGWPFARAGRTDDFVFWPHGTPRPRRCYMTMNSTTAIGTKLVCRDPEEDPDNIRLDDLPGSPKVSTLAYHFAGPGKIYLKLIQEEVAKLIGGAKDANQSEVARWKSIPIALVGRGWWDNTTLGQLCPDDKFYVQ